MADRECDIYLIRGDNPDEQGKADLTLRLKDGREVVLCVCPACLNDLIATLVPMQVDLIRRREEYRQSHERRN